MVLLLTVRELRVVIEGVSPTADEPAPPCDVDLDVLENGPPTRSRARSALTRSTPPWNGVQGLICTNEPLNVAPSLSPVGSVRKDGWIDHPTSGARAVSTAGSGLA